MCSGFFNHLDLRINSFPYASTMFGHKAIPRPTAGALAKAAGYKWYNEINQVLARDETMSKKEVPFSTTSEGEKQDSAKSCQL
jgi:hypothetical protein